MKYLYGGSWERYPIQDGETWTDRISGSCITVCDIITRLPKHMLQADMIYVDPPWSLGNANGFIKKAGMNNYLDDFSLFINALFLRVVEISPAICYIEIGKQHVTIFRDKLSSIFPIVQEWKIKYYRKNPCFLLRGGDSPLDYDFTGIDDVRTPTLAINVESPQCVADLCTGQGLTAIAAYRLNKRFVGTELNKRRLAVAIDRVNKLGGRYEGPVS